MSTGGLRDPGLVEDTPHVAANWEFARTLAYTDEAAYVVTSPNADFIPETDVGLVKVFLCKDYRYGVHDPIQWPQVFPEDHEYLCAILRRDALEDPLLACIWDTPSEARDFKLLEGVVFKCLGLISPAWFALINTLVDQIADEVNVFAQDRALPVVRFRRIMLDARDRVLSFPSTYRDACVQVRTVQRYWLMCRASLDFARLTATTNGDSAVAVNTRLIGAFTTHPHVVQRLYRAGIPVWHIRAHVGHCALDAGAIVMRQPAASVVSEPLQSGTPPVYSGLTGKHHLHAVARRACIYYDISHAPMLTRYDNESLQVGAPDAPSLRTAVTAGRETPGALRSIAPSRATSGAAGRQQRDMPYHRIHPSHLRGRDKFVDLEHPWMPPSLPVWRQAMSSVDRSAPAKRQGELWGYWIPEPALLLGPQTLEGVERFLSDWLRVRPAWLYLLAHPNSAVTRIQPQWWRDFLNGDVEGDPATHITRRTKRLAQVKAVFEVAFAMDDFIGSPDRAVTWFTFRITSLLNRSLPPFILWELYETGFRYELLALDHILVATLDDAAEDHRLELLSRVFPKCDLFYVRELPTAPVGLNATLPSARVPYLEAFRQVLARWPLAPQKVRAGEPLALTTRAADIEMIEQEMATFYVCTFFAYSGRAPIIPHALPPYRAL